MNVSSGFRDECGVFGVFDAEDAARLAYLGLYALQHRGQESAGIATLDGGGQILVEREMGYVADVFDEARLSRLPGRTAIGHVRYATAGASLLANAQPIVFATGRGALALAHNGNLVNAREIRSQLEASGALFTTSSDSEVILHLVARSKAPTLTAAIAEALSDLRGAYSLLILSREGIFAVLSDPNGIRPLSLGTREGSPVVASETCAFDLIGARFERDVEPGEMLVIAFRGEGSSAGTAPLSRPTPASSSTSSSRAPTRRLRHECPAVRQAFGAPGREHPARPTSSCPFPTRQHAALGYSRQTGLPLRLGMVRSHYVGRTFIEPHQASAELGVNVKLQPGAGRLRGSASCGRGLDRPRHDLRQDGADAPQAGAYEVHVRMAARRSVSRATTASTSRRGRELIASNALRRGDARSSSRRTARATSRSKGCSRSCAPAEQAACTACFTGIYPVAIEEEEREKESALALRV